MRRLLVTLLALPLLACPAGETPKPAESDPRLAVSADGARRLRIVRIHQDPSEAGPGHASLDMEMAFEDPAGNVFLAEPRPLRHATTPDGEELAIQQQDPTCDVVAGRVGIHRLQVGPPRSQLARIVIDLPLAVVDSWTAHRFEGLGIGDHGPFDAAPFRLLVHVRSTEVKVVVSVPGPHTPGEEPLPLPLMSELWGLSRVRIREAEGDLLEMTGGGGGRDGTYGIFDRKTGKEPGDLALPIDLAIDMPDELTNEIVTFEFKDVPLPSLGQSE